MLFNKNGPHLNWAPLSEPADSPTVGAGLASTFKRGEDGAKEKGEEREGGGGIIIGREMCYPQGLLLIASLMSLWDELVVGWIWMQLWLLRGGESPLSTRQLSLTLFLPPFFSFLPSRHRHLHPREDPPPSPVRSGPAVMDWHPLSVKPALWFFNEPEEEFRFSGFLKKIFN